MYLPHALWDCVGVWENVFKRERERRKERNRNGERFIATFVDISKVIVLSHMRDKTRMFEQERRDIMVVVVDSINWMQSHCLAFFLFCS